jgi:GNAT superfamily N-acetyltransferase
MIIRTLCVPEEPAVAAFMLALSAHDRYRRFCRPMTDAAIRAYLRVIDWSETLILGAFDRDARLIGMLELCDAGRSAEIAVAVAPEHRKHGVARALLQRALLEATGLGKERAVLTCLTENLPMRRLARSAGLAATTTASSEIESELLLKEPDLSEVVRAGTHELVGSISYATALCLPSRTDLARQLWRTPELRNAASRTASHRD